MRAARAAAALITLLAATDARAHRLDEYLQATTIALEKTRVHGEIRLTPGVDVFPLAFALIDTDADGAVSPSEQRAYASTVLGDLALTIDGRRLPLHLVSSKFAPTQALQDGQGEIQLQFAADLPGRALKRRLVFENRHQIGIGAYLVNCLVPADTDLQVTAQSRNFDQSLYQLDYTDASALAGSLSQPHGSPVWEWLGGAVICFIAGAALLRRRRAGNADPVIEK